MKKLYDLIRIIDIYGCEVGMKYKGSKTHKTFIGGIMTLLTASILVVNVFRGLSVIRSPETDLINQIEVSAVLPQGKMFKYKDMNFRVGY